MCSGVALPWHMGPLLAIYVCVAGSVHKTKMTLRNEKDFVWQNRTHTLLSKTLAPSRGVFTARQTKRLSWVALFRGAVCPPPPAEGTLRGLQRSSGVATGGGGCAPHPAEGWHQRWLLTDCLVTQEGGRIRRQRWLQPPILEVAQLAEQVRVPGCDRVSAASLHTASKKEVAGCGKGRVLCSFFLVGGIIESPDVVWGNRKAPLSLYQPSPLSLSCGL